jgi:Ca2+/Na+ antiporter
MTIVAAIFGAAKLVAGFEYLTQFPRDMVPIAGFRELWQGIFVAFATTSIAPPSLPPDWFANDVWGDGVRITFGHHELDFRITVLPVLLAAAWLVRSAAGIIQRRSVRVAPSQLGFGIVFAAIAALPILLNWHQPELSEILKSLPIIRNSSSLMRWHCILVLLGIVAAALIIDRSPLSASSRALVGGAVAIMVVFLNASAERKHEIRSADYAFNAIDAAYQAMATSRLVPPITHVVDPELETGAIQSARDRNDALADGGTSAQCYEPMFGYFLELHPRGPLAAGPALAARDGLLNVKNPACMVYPGANECRPGDHFRAAEIDAARRFLSYRSFDFRLPWWQRLANWTSVGALVAALAIFALAAIRRIMNRGPRPGIPTPPDATPTKAGAAA